MNDQHGLVHIYYGEGKGKTSAAFGLALRCAGYGQRVLILQFLKGRDSGELRMALRIPELCVLRGEASEKFVFQMNEAEKEAVRENHNHLLREAIAVLSSGEYQMVVLDELLDAWDLGLLDQELVLALLRSRPAVVEVVLTGHQLPPPLEELADYISRVGKERHPYDRGVQARKGIEF